MFDPAIIFQRTLAGREEIYHKKQGLTQSERLVLIMIDGITSSKGVRAKLPVLTDERFSRALNTLGGKELILEVFMPVEGQSADEVERTVIDRFLQQDPTDPLTIISFDPEEEFGLAGSQHKPSPPPAWQTDDAFPPIPELPVIASPEPDEQAAEPAMDEALIEQAELLAQEVRAARRSVPHIEEGSVHRESHHEESAPMAQITQRPERLHWGYWLIGLGFAFIAGYLLARLRG